MKALPPANPPFGVLRTNSSDKFGAVYVNGKYMGHVDEFRWSRYAAPSRRRSR